MKILQNEVQCLKCGDRIYSAYTHDFVTCSCGAIAIDGGMTYLKRSGESRNYKDISIVLEHDLYGASIQALAWAKEHERNELGTLCALFRAFRDSGYAVKKVGDIDEK